MEKKLEEQIARIKATNRQAADAAKKRWDQVAKPLSSLGLLEAAVIRIAGITGSADLHIEKKALVVMCADNGIVEEGVTQTGQEVTGIVTQNFTKGHTCACIMAEKAGVDLFPVDIGVAGSFSDLGDKNPLLHRRISDGTKNFLKEPAMTREQTNTAIQTGIRIVGMLKDQGYGLIATGEMGIGNTTTSSAVSSVLLGKDPEVMTGKGAGLSDQAFNHKILVIREGIRLHQPNQADAIDVLSKVGGYDLAGLAGVFLGGAIYQIPVIIDGFISAAAALAASVICKEAISYMMAAHVSAEPGGMLLLDTLGLKPLIYAQLCLGEGTGALTLVPLLDMAAAVYSSMSTFQEIKVADYQPL